MQVRYICVPETITYYIKPQLHDSFHFHMYWGMLRKFRAEPKLYPSCKIEMLSLQPTASCLGGLRKLQFQNCLILCVDLVIGITSAVPKTLIRIMHFSWGGLFFLTFRVHEKGRMLSLTKFLSEIYFYKHFSGDINVPVWSIFYIVDNENILLLLGENSNLVLKVQYKSLWVKVKLCYNI